MPRLNLANVFTAEQTIKFGAARLTLSDDAAVADARRFSLVNTGQTLYVQTNNDLGGYQSNAALFTRTGDFTAARDIIATRDHYEKGRTTPIGHWINFTPQMYDQGSSVIPNGTVYGARYMVMGKTLFLSLLSDVVGPANNSSWFFYLPGGYTTAGYSATPVFVNASPPIVCSVNTAPNDIVRLYRDVMGGGGFLPSGTVRLAFQLTVAIN